MSIVIPCASAIGVLGCLMIYHLYLNSTFNGTYKDKLYYLNAHLILLITIITYVIILMNEIILGNTNAITYFYVKCMFVNPLILINVGRYTSIPINSYIYIILLDELMILSGYISYITQNNILGYTMFGLGCICYLAINIIYIQNLKELQQRPNLKYRIFCIIYCTIALLWSFYPIVHILLKTNIITDDIAIDIYAILDIFTKGIFTTLLIGSREVYQSRNSCLKNMINKLFKIHPFEINQVQESIEDISDIIRVNNKVTITISQYSPDITDSVKSVRSDNLDTVFKIKTSPNSNRHSIVTVMEPLQENIKEVEPETPPVYTF
jgi:bacteriorhodopsin